jgi:hypothetical protein
MLAGVVSAALDLGEIKAILTAKMIEATTMRRVNVFIVYFSIGLKHTSMLQPSVTAPRYDPG